jgi:hypothetical protein
MLSQGSIGRKIDKNQSAETTSLGSEPNSSSYRNTAQRFSPICLMRSPFLCGLRNRWMQTSVMLWSFYSA